VDIETILDIILGVAYVGVGGAWLSAAWKHRVGFMLGRLSFFLVGLCWGGEALLNFVHAANGTAIVVHHQEWVLVAKGLQSLLSLIVWVIVARSVMQVWKAPQAVSHLSAGIVALDEFDEEMDGRRHQGRLRTG
jgi:hypothetical protein